MVRNQMFIELVQSNGSILLCQGFRVFAAQVEVGNQPWCFFSQIKLLKRSLQAQRFCHRVIGVVVQFMFLMF